MHAGNILVTNSPLTGGGPQLLEYTAFGQLVRQHKLPVYEPGGARDLVTDALGNVQIFNGTFAPRLTTYDSDAGGFVQAEVQFDGWSTADVPTSGGMASYRNYIYATDTKTQDDVAERARHRAVRPGRGLRSNGSTASTATSSI